MSKKRTKTPAKAPEPLGIAKTYQSVDEMIRDVVGDRFADELVEKDKARRLAKSLTALRCSQGMSQTALARRMRCGQPKVSKIEAARDEDLSFGDLVAYTKALGVPLHIALRPEPTKGDRRIQTHLAGIKHELGELAALTAPDGDEPANELESFALELMQSLVSTVGIAAERLPREDEPVDAFRVDVVGEDGERL